MSITCKPSWTTRVENQKPRVVFFRSFLGGFSQPKTDFKVVSSVAQKKRNRKTDSVFSVGFFHVPYVKNAYISVWKSRYGWTHGQLRHTAAAAAQQQQQQQRKGAVVGVGRLNTSTTTQSTVLHVYLPHSLQYYRQVHNPLIFHYWFPCMLRLPVTPLPKMNSELTSHDPWDCLLLAGIMCYQVCVMCYVLRGAVVRDAWCMMVRFHALLRPLNCGPGATFLVEFSMLLAVHIHHT